jgi:replication-associated recombination protein RarA
MRNFEAKYEPKNWDELVFSERNVNTKFILEKIATAEIAQNVILFGANGTGKTTIAKAVTNSFYATYDEDIAANFVAMANADVKEYQRSKIMFHFSASGKTWHIFDEIDKCSYKNVYNELHHTLDDKTGHQYILTTNSIVDIPNGLKSRAKVLIIDVPTPEEFLPRARFICTKEGISTTDEKILSVLRSGNEDLRSYYKALELL